MTNLGKYYDDPNIWGAKNNAFIDALKKGEYICLAANGNEPPTIKQYTRFSVYNTESVTLSNDAVTGDNEYSAGASITNPISEAIFEDSEDVTFIWGGTTRGVTAPSISDGTWYIYCSGSYDNSTSTIGQGLYFVSTSTPTYNYEYGGWYLLGASRAIGQFTVASSVVSNIIEYNEINNIISYDSNGKVSVIDASISDNLDVLHPGSDNYANFSMNSTNSFTINPMVDNGTDAIRIKLFKNTNTTGPVDFDILKGDASIDIIHRLSVKSDSYLCSDGGKLALGHDTPLTTLDVDGSISGSQLIITTGTYNTIDVSETHVIRANTSSGDITINGLNNGAKAGQIVYIYKDNTSNNLIINHYNASGTEKIYTRSSVDVTLSTRGSVYAIFNGSSWMLNE